MGRLWFFIQEALRALKRNAAPTIAAIVTTIVTVVLLGVLIPALFFTQSTSQGVREELAVKAFLYDDATKTEVAALKARIEGLPHVRSVQFVSKRQALNILQSRLNDKNILKELNTNPLPASFTVKPDDASNLTLVCRELAPMGHSGKSMRIGGMVWTTHASR